MVNVTMDVSLRYSSWYTQKQKARQISSCVCVTGSCQLLHRHNLYREVRIVRHLERSTSLQTHFINIEQWGFAIFFVPFGVHLIRVV